MFQRRRCWPFLLTAALCLALGGRASADAGAYFSYGEPPVQMDGPGAAPAAPPAAMPETPPTEAPAAASIDPWTIGDYKVVPYGVFWADMIYATERVFPGGYTLFVPSREVQGEDAFDIDARRSRFGLNVTGPNVPLFGGATSGGKVEIDFQGSSAQENKASVLLRHAYWEVKNDFWRMLVGQNWDVVSPLYPHTLNYSVGWFGGNIGYRRPQFRWERYLHFSPTSLVTLQLSLNQDVVTDFANVATINREPTDWPVIEGRVGWTLGHRGKGCDPIVLGISGHVGETQFDFNAFGPPPGNLPPEDDARFRTWSLNVDAKIPVTDNLGFQGEYFVGANLSTFLGGIGQGVCPCLRVPIRANGGWAEVYWDWQPWLHSAAGFGIDDPNNRDSLFGRSYNQFIFANIVYDITEKFAMGFEVSYWKTLYQEDRVGQIPPEQLTPTEPGESVTLDWMCKYAF